MTPSGGSTIKFIGAETLKYLCGLGVNGWSLKVAKKDKENMDFVCYLDRDRNYLQMT